MVLYCSTGAPCMTARLASRFASSSVLATLLCAWTLAAGSPLDLNAALPVAPQLKVGRLANGLTWYIQKNAKPEHKLELRLVVKAGSILEDEDQQGLAHFTEHMAFNGSTHFRKHELVNYLQSIGVKFGADRMPIPRSTKPSMCCRCRPSAGRTWTRPSRCCRTGPRD